VRQRCDCKRAAGTAKHQREQDAAARRLPRPERDRDTRELRRD